MFFECLGNFEIEPGSLKTVEGKFFNYLSSATKYIGCDRFKSQNNALNILNIKILRIAIIIGNYKLKNLCNRNIKYTFI